MIFSLNATIPVFLLMVVGYLLRRYTGLLDDTFAMYMNKFVFGVALPVQMFQNISQSDFQSVWNGRVVLFCAVTGILSVFVMIALSLRLKDVSLRAEFVQAGYRGSLALLGSALMMSIYGEVGPLALGIISAVPVYNIAAVLVLMLMKPGGQLDKKTLKQTVIGVFTNPLILSVLISIAWTLLKIPQPPILKKSISSLAAMTVPMGLLALGASVDFKKILGCWKPGVVCTLCKLVLFPAIFLPFAIWLGFREELLVVVLIVLASPGTVASFSMARSMGHEGVLTAGSVMLTTVCSAFTFTAWLYVLRTFGLI